MLKCGHPQGCELEGVCAICHMLKLSKLMDKSYQNLLKEKDEEIAELRRRLKQQFTQ